MGQGCVVDYAAAAAAAAAGAAAGGGGPVAFAATAVQQTSSLQLDPDELEWVEECNAQSGGRRPAYGVQRGVHCGADE